MPAEVLKWLKALRSAISLPATFLNVEQIQASVKLSKINFEVLVPVK